MKREYKNIALYPFLSTRQSKSIVSPTVKYDKAMTEEYSLKLESEKENIMITPPVETVFTITQESKIFNGLLTTNLMKLNYSLREGFFEFKENKENEKSKLFISLNIVNELRGKYNVDGIIVGDIVFNTDSNGRLIITFAQARLMDTETLEIMKTVTYVYESGENMSSVAQQIAEGIKYDRITNQQ